jgi:hypothetical protein
VVDGHQNGHQFSYSVSIRLNGRLDAHYSLMLRTRFCLSSRLRENAYESALPSHLSNPSGQQILLC